MEPGTAVKCISPTLLMPQKAGFARLQLVPINAWAGPPVYPTNEFIPGIWPANKFPVPLGASPTKKKRTLDPENPPGEIIAAHIAVILLPRRRQILARS
jgi:hypothetical protein